MWAVCTFVIAILEAGILVSSFGSKVILYEHYVFQDQLVI